MIKYVTLAIGLMSISALAAPSVGDMSEIPDSSIKKKQGFHGQVGLGVANIPEYVGGDESESVGVPLINVSYNDRFYFRFNKLGGWLFKSDNGFRVGGVITAHRGIDEKDVPDKFNWVGDRDDSVMAGINMAYTRGKFATEAGFVTDVSDESDGAKLYIQASYTFIANENYTLTAMGKLESLDEDMVSYYYDNNESATNATIGLIGTYKLTDRWSLLGAVTATSLGDEISDSPIVEDDSYSMALVGATYSF